MAGITKIKTRAGIEVVKRTGPDGKERYTSFHVKLVEKLGEVTLTQLRVVAEESREMILDKLFAGSARFPGSRVVSRPPPGSARRLDIPTSDRRPYRHAPLADSTVARKAALDQDGRRLIATGEYAYGIEVFRGTKNGKRYYTVRPKPGKHIDSGVTHRVLAAFHEFGTSKMPARPHWGPVLRVVKRIMDTSRPDIRAEALRLALRGAR